MQLTDFTTLTFDCYGTLIDWESGIVEATRPWLERERAAVAPERLLEAFGRAESAQQAETPGMLYPELLGRALRRMGEALGVPVGDEDAAAFGASVRCWPAFADSADSLRHLKQHYRLVVLSNVDNASFAASNRKLGVTFDAVYTAEDVGSYKPDARNFAYMLERLAGSGVERSEILHVAQSLFHDHVPAKRAGLACCWIDRRAGRGGFGATVPPPEAVRPDFRFGSMAELVAEHRRLGGA